MPSRLALLWTRLRERLARIFRRAPPRPGRFEQGSKFSWRGLLLVAPWIWPRRDYLIYVPAGDTRWRFRRRALLVLVHGCRQTAEDIATGSRITRLADALDCLVLLPKQNPRANAWGCWNWFDRRTSAGAGETAILAAQIRAVRRRYRVHRKRVFAAGLSSGAGLVAALTIRNSGLVAGAFLHSGIAAGAASSPMTALDVLQRGPDTDIVAIARAAREQGGTRAHAVPVIAVQGMQDDVVAPMHATEIIRQALAFARYPGVEAAPAPLPAPLREDVASTAEGRRVTTRDWHEDSRLIARLVLVEGLGHAWSGGDPAVKFFDPHGPAATELLRAFMADALQ
ncbi:MAG TPA: PHB depolymerase family esterase [Casimicrobiaceae bacterium]|nr:PHB depolymerase family esterase [Casimicrobiaceae bacterium]